MRQTLTRLMSSGTTTSSSRTALLGPRRTRPRPRRGGSARGPASVALDAIGWVSPAHSKAIASGGSASAVLKYSATSPARSRERPALSSKTRDELGRERLRRPHGRPGAGGRCCGDCISSRTAAQLLDVLGGIFATPDSKWIGGTTFLQLDGLRLPGRRTSPLLQSVAPLACRAAAGSCAQCWNGWSPDRCRSTDSLSVGLCPGTASGPALDQEGSTTALEAAVYVCIRSPAVRRRARRLLRRSAAAPEESGSIVSG